MRRYLAPMSVVLVVAAAMLTSQAGAQPAHEARALPRLIAGPYSGIKPREIFFSGDSGDIVTKIKWKSWSQTTAVGHGTSNIQGCNPNCAQGTETPVAATVTLSKPRDGHFTKVVELRAGNTLVANYGRPLWPESAHR
jgi:hypothetical protein